MNKAGPVIKKGFAYYMKKELNSDTVYIPQNWDCPAQQFVFLITSIDEHFYSISKAPKKARLFQKVDPSFITNKEVAENASSGLPSFNITSEFFRLCAAMGSLINQ